MEILSYSSASCCDVVNLRWNSAVKGSSFGGSKPPAFRKSRVIYANFDSASEVVSCYHINQSFSKKLNHRGGFRSLDSHEKFKQVGPIMSSGSSDGYVIGAEEDANISETGEPLTKVLIPGIPNESNGELSAPISSCFWEWKPKFNVHYEKAGSENLSSPPVLFLPGFGVGSFHYEKQMKDLGRDFRVWAIDFLGQGMSLPLEDPAPRTREEGMTDKNNLGWGFGDESEPWASELVYSIDLWQDQVIGEPVYITGNSLGGFVALYFAACNPHLVKGVTLLNATPFWGFLPNPIRSPTLAKLFPWAGTFPLPANVRKLVEFVWQKISDPRSIAQILEQVYADHSTDVDKVFSRIVETSEHPAAAASFASIMFAPQGELSFKEALSREAMQRYLYLSALLFSGPCLLTVSGHFMFRCQMSNIPVCLMYGKEDPWVQPIWGFQVKKQVPEAPFYEISPAGHCPHDEVPEVVNYLLRGWIRNLESQGLVALPLLDAQESMQINIARDLEFIRDGSKKSVKVRFFGSKFSLWDKISSYISSQFGKLELKS